MTDDQTQPATRTMKVQVSMDGLRQNLAREYIELVDMFNEVFAHDWEIDKDELRDKLLELRSTIGVLHCCYDTEREHFSDLSHETSKMDIIKFAPIS